MAIVQCREVPTLDRPTLYGLAAGVARDFIGIRVLIIGIRVLIIGIRVLIIRRSARRSTAWQVLRALLMTLSGTLFLSRDEAKVRAARYDSDPHKGRSDAC